MDNKFMMKNQEYTVDDRLFNQWFYNNWIRTEGRKERRGEGERK